MMFNVTTTVIIFTIAAFAVGLLIGGVIVSLRIGEIDAGRFVITYNDPEKNLVGIDLDVDLPEIEASRFISFQVVVDGKDKKLIENSQGEDS